jgi:hypothetical protein
MRGVFGGFYQISLRRISTVLVAYQPVLGRRAYYQYSSTVKDGFVWRFACGEVLKCGCTRQDWWWLGTFDGSNSEEARASASRAKNPSK